MEKYDPAVIEQVIFDSCDVVAASGGEGDIPLDPAVWYGSEAE